jgi:hypothetical protein
MPKEPKPEQFSEKETQKRMDDALRRALNTPPKPHNEIGGKKGKGAKPPKPRINRHQGR